MTLRSFAMPLVLLLALLALAAIIVLPDRASFSQSRPIAFWSMVSNAKCWHRDKSHDDLS